MHESIRAKRERQLKVVFNTIPEDTPLTFDELKSRVQAVDDSENVIPMDLVTDKQIRRALKVVRQEWANEPFNLPHLNEKGRHTYRKTRNTELLDKATDVTVKKSFSELDNAIVYTESKIKQLLESSPEVAFQAESVTIALEDAKRDIRRILSAL